MWLRRLLAVPAALALVLTALDPATAIRGAGDDTVTIISPVSGAVVSGITTVSTSAPDQTVSVAFEWSKSQSDQWAAIGMDQGPEDGWETGWDTLGYSGQARLRAIATIDDGTGTSTEHSAVVDVRVDNERPEITLRISRPAFSPNGDGRLDTLRSSIRTTEPARLDVRLKDSQGRVLRTWRSGSLEQNRTFEWGGRANGSMVNDGRYRIEAVAIDEVGLRDRAGRRVIVDTRAPKLKLRRISPEPLRTGSRVAVRYALRDRSRRSKLRIRLTGHHVNRTLDVGRRLSGRGTVRRRLSAPTGAYRVRLVGKDDAGNVGHSRARPWRVLRAAKARVFRRLERTGRKVALTFDDCYDTGAWRAILRSLRRHGARATFFCNGVHVASNPRLARRTIKWGNAIGSHTPDHALLTSFPASGTEQRLRKDISIWWRVARRTSAPYFRPPYGAYNQATLIGAGAAAHPRVILWDVDTHDWTRPGAGVIAARAASARPGSIVLMHAIDQTADAMSSILRDLDGRRLRPVTLPTLFHAARSSGSLRTSVDRRRSWQGLYASQGADGSIPRSRTSLESLTKMSR